MAKKRVADASLKRLNAAADKMPADRVQYVDDLLVAFRELQTPQGGPWGSVLIRNGTTVLSLADDANIDASPFQRLKAWLMDHSKADDNLAVDVHRFLENLSIKVQRRENLAVAKTSTKTAVTSKPAPATMSGEERALAVLAKNAGLSKTEIAKKAGVNRGSLRRMTRFMKAWAAMEGNGKADIKRRQDAKQNINDDDDE